MDTPFHTTAKSKENMEKYLWNMLYSIYETPRPFQTNRVCLLLLDESEANLSKCSFSSFLTGFICGKWESVEKFFIIVPQIDAHMFSDDHRVGTFDFIVLCWCLVDWKPSAESRGAIVKTISILSSQTSACRGPILNLMPIQKRNGRMIIKKKRV